MKYGVVFYKESINIGDEVQTLAAIKLLNEENVVLLDRENLANEVQNEEVKLLCNGWFMHDATHWPPHQSIKPYFISFHMAKYPSIRKKMLSPSLKDYYSKYQPIGCRDYETKRLFEGMGIEAKFTGCLTLTLPSSNQKRTNKIIVTDLFINDILKGSYARKVTYKLIPKKWHKDVVLNTHIRKNSNLSADEKLNEAEKMLELYSSAKMVVTSRIHCALPCLALGTPVVFFDFGYVRKTNRDRFEGILDLMHVVRPYIPFHENRRVDKLMKAFGLHRLFYPFIKKLSINWDKPLPNPEKYQAIASSIREEVKKEFP